jgi:hypothetical protein
MVKLWLYSYWRKVPLLLLLLEESAVAGEDGGRPALLMRYENGNMRIGIWNHKIDSAFSAPIICIFC